MKNLKQHIVDSALSIFVWSDDGGKNALADQLTTISDTHAKERAIAFAYQKANPGAIEIPQEAYDALAAEYDQWVPTANV